MAKKKLSRDQKRKHKLEKRSHIGAARQGAQVEFLTKETEQVIHETFMSYGTAMLDADAHDAVRQLVVDVQQGKISQESAGAELPNAKGALIWNIKQAWTEKHTLDHLPSLLAAQGLQYLAHRIDDIAATGSSHSYLRFLQGSQDGVKVLVSEIEGGHWSPEEDALRKLGLAWLKNSNAETWDVFQKAATDDTAGGHARAVANVCQYLYGAVQQAAVEQALRPVLDAAHTKLEDEADAADAVTETADTPAA
ncbi:MAG: hypothetical protein HZB53_00300 [Chloroflexi bacterium]|nr:hypothetical protein [Chloroflexota bacterium]